MEQNEKLPLEELADLGVVSSNDKILGYSAAGKKFGMIPLSFVTNDGYACRRWDMTKSSPVGEAVGNIDYLRQLPSLLGLGCYLVDKNHGRRKLDPTNHYKFATGETARLDGSMGDYMWGWDTKWYYAWWVEGNYHYEAISLKPIVGRENYTIPVASTSALGVSVIDRDNLELVSVINTDPRYRGGNNDATLDSAFNTYLGQAGTNLDAATFATYARKKGEGWEAYWYTFPAVIGILFRVIFGNRNMQASYNASKTADGLYQGGLGSGVTGGWPDGFSSRPFLPTSVGVELADACGVSSYAVKGAGGSTIRTYSIPVFFGLKNPFGYLGRWERGCLINKIASGAGDVYVMPRMYTNYNMNSLSGLLKVAQVPPCHTASTCEYIQELSMNHLCHKPTVVGSPATESTYYADTLYNDNASSGLRVPSVGGFASNGGAAGPEFLHVYYGVSTAYVYYGSPLCEAEEDWDTTPHLVVA